MKYFARSVVANRWLILAMTLGITLALALGTSSLRVVIDPDASLPQTHRFVQATNEIEAVFGNKFAAVIAVRDRSGTPLTPEVLAATAGITKRLLDVPGVVRSRVLSLTASRAKDITGNDTELQVQSFFAGGVTTEEDSLAIIAKIRASPAFRDLLVSPDGATSVILADFAKDPQGFRAMEARVEAVVAPFRNERVEIALGGQPMFLAVIERYSDRMGPLFLLAAVLIGLIHFEAFRSVQGLVLPLVTGILASIWAVGILGWAKIPLDAFSIATPILILAVAAGHAVQLLKRYYEALSQRCVDSGPTIQQSREALIESLVAVGPTLAAAGAIAAVSFASLGFFGISSIRNFGVFTAIGIASAVLIELTFMPALRACLRPPKQSHVRRERSAGVWARMIDRLARSVVNRPGLTLGLSALVVAMAILAASGIRADNSLRYYFADSEQVRKDDTLINEWTVGSNVFYLMLKGTQADDMKRPDVLQTIATLKAFIEQDPNVGKVIALSDFISDISGAQSGQDTGPLPDSQDVIAQYLLLYSLSGDPEDFNSVVDYDYMNSLITVFIHDDNYQYLRDLERRVNEFSGKILPHNISLVLGGSVFLPAALNETMVHGKILNIAQIFVFVFLLSAMFFRSFIAGALVALPLAMSTAVNFGIMGLSGIPLQLSTAGTSASAIGIGADFAIYLLYRLRQEVSKGTTLEEAALTTYQTAGRAVLYVTTAIAVGYAVFTISPGFHFHLWFGLLLSVAVTVNAVAALTTFMALLIKIRPRFLYQATENSPRKAWTSGVAVLIAGFALAGGMDPAAAGEPEPRMLVERDFIVSKVKDSSAEVQFRLVHAEEND